MLVQAVLCADARAPAAAPASVDLGAQLDALAARHFPADQPGAAVLVRRGDQVLLRKGYGRATLSPAVAVAPEMTFRIGSITKQFTAAAIMHQLLVQTNGIPFSLKPVPASETAFFIQGTLVRYSFLRDERSGRVTGMEERDDDGSVEVYARTDELLPEQRAVVAVDPAVLERYVGEYQWRPGPTLKVTREAAHLYIQVGDKDRIEVFPISPTEFFLKVIDAQLTFSAEDNGPAQRLVIHQDGRDLPHKRVR